MFSHVYIFKYVIRQSAFHLVSG